MPSLRDDLAEGADELRETHISWVFLRGHEVFKVKKPVSMGFLDFTTIDERKKACEAEVELNARSSPDVYLGLVPVTRDASGRHRLGGEGETVDWAVHMRRLRDGDRADSRLAEGTLSVAQVDAIASYVADFHARCRADEQTSSFGSVGAIAVNVRENFVQTRAVIAEHLSPAEAAEIEEWQLSFLRDNEPLFEARRREGRVRDGHGDLRLEHVYFESGEVRVIDCIEFNERFRYADVCADLAFLSMDLAWHDRVDLAERLLATYARDTGDFDLYPLVDFYESYRAYVRGKIASFVLASKDLAHGARERAAKEARRYFLLALAAERTPVVPPVVIAVGGLLASGKSTISDRLGAVLGAPHVNSDRVRKQLLGARPTERLYEGAWSGAYDPKLTEQVYAECYRAARVVVSSGRPVILDASFRSPEMRAAARAIASELGVPFRFVECRLDPAICRVRLKERDMTTSISDGRLEIFDDFLKKWQPPNELDPEEHVVVDTSRAIEESLATLRARIPSWSP